MQDLINARVHDYYWKQDLNCAITTIKTLAELFPMDIHPQVIEGTFGLNAGRCGTQCGLIEGALIFIGIYGSQKKIIGSKQKTLCLRFSNEFDARK
ncbi:hypothetical protein HA075_26130 [bacterium BFN5]|nr:hypothetical protein HA075_26130 [bacterium BFN5]